MGAPVERQRNGPAEMVCPSRVAGLKKVKAVACCPCPSTLSAKAFDSLIRPWAWESGLTPPTTSGGANEACAPQLTVAAPTARSLPQRVSAYGPHGLTLITVFFASAST